MRHSKRITTLLQTQATSLSLCLLAMGTTVVDMIPSRNLAELSLYTLNNNLGKVRQALTQ